MSIARQISKVPENWRGELTREKVKNFETAIATEFGIFTIRSSDLEPVCITCQRPAEYTVLSTNTQPPRKRVKTSCPALPRLSTVRFSTDYKGLSREEIFAKVKELVEAGKLKVSSCCSFGGDRGSFGDKTTCFAWSSQARQAPTPNKFDYRSFVGVQSEPLETDFDESNDPEHCECGADDPTEHCSVKIGTSGSNDIGRNCARLPRRISHV